MIFTAILALNISMKNMTFNGDGTKRWPLAREGDNAPQKYYTHPLPSNKSLINKKPLFKKKEIKNKTPTSVLFFLHVDIFQDFSWPLPTSDEGKSYLSHQSFFLNDFLLFLFINSIMNDIFVLYVSDFSF